MRKIITLLLVAFALPVHAAWGPTGHRVVGHIAEQYLSRKASRALEYIMQGESLARASTWMDDMKSDPEYRYMSPWHYVNMAADDDYATLDKPEEGEVVGKINQLIAELKAGGLTRDEEVFRIRCLVHLVGDLHQPMHTARREDLGGNRVRIQWFGDDTNLHRLWDSDLIEHQQLSYTEIANFINHPSKEQLKEWSVIDTEAWAMESHEIANTLYDSVEEGENYSYRYNFEYYHIAERRMLMGGVRLAAIFNEIYG